MGQNNNGFYNKDLNGMLEKLAKGKWTLYELKILLVIVRKTLGWRKESDWISYGQFEKATGIDRRNISRVIRSLEKKGIIEVDRTVKSKPQYRIKK